MNASFAKFLSPILSIPPFEKTALLIKIPDTVIQQANVTEEAIRLEIAIALFREEIFTLGQASEFLGIPQLLFQKELARRKISIHYDVEDLHEDLKTLHSIA